MKEIIIGVNFKDRNLVAALSFLCSNKPLQGNIPPNCLGFKVVPIIKEAISDVNKSS